MTVPRLIKSVETWQKVVEVSDVRDQIVDSGYYDAITIAPFDKPAERLLGNTINYVSALPYGAEKEYCVIRFNQNLSVNLQRLVCVKELVHCMDTAVLRVATKIQLNALLDEILHDKATHPSTLAVPALFEDVAIYQALAILCPEEVREEFFVEFHKPDNHKQTILTRIADRFQIPIEYAGCLMLPNWKPFREQMINLPY